MEIFVKKDSNGINLYKSDLFTVERHWDMKKILEHHLLFARTVPYLKIKADERFEFEMWTCHLVEHKKYFKIVSRQISTRENNKLGSNSLYLNV